MSNLLADWVLEYCRENPVHVREDFGEHVGEGSSASAVPRGDPEELSRFSHEWTSDIAVAANPFAGSSVHADVAVAQQQAVFVGKTASAGWPHHDAVLLEQQAVGYWAGGLEKVNKIFKLLLAQLKISFKRTSAGPQPLMVPTKLSRPFSRL